MKAKRPSLALKADAFAVHAIPQPDPVAVAVATATPTAASTPPARNNLSAPLATERKDERAGAKRTSKATQPGRTGKVQVVAWVPEGRRAELKIVAAKLRRTIHD